MNIVTMYFAQWVVDDLGLEDIFYSISFSASMVLVAITSPILGAVADARGRRLAFLFAFTVLTCVFTASIAGAAAAPSIAVAGVLGLALFCLANYFYGGSLVFYNALLPAVSTERTIGRVSGLGVGLGYAGAIAGLLMVMPFVAGSLPWFGSGRPAAFIPTAVFFVFFAIPAFIWIKEPAVAAKTATRPVDGLKKVFRTLREARKRPNVFRFLIAKLFYEDPIMTAIMFMAVYANEVMGMPDEAKIPLFIVSTTFAVAGSLGAGFLADFIGAKRTLVAALIGWLATFVVIAAAMRTEMLWIGGAMVGTFLGATWTAARPFYTSLVPSGELGEYFGLYALSGKAAAIVGPLLWGAVVLAASGLGPGKYRMAVASLGLFTVIGLILLLGVKTPVRAARTVG
ncbi:MAG: MFS transporter [Candidatus Coatesbacteria bacterium]|nr:MAG: MFS transporter [Candidatus Coatesbacteria bacterium]